MSYQEFAYYYDSLMDPSYYDDYLSFLNKHITFKNAIELGCGTGEMTFRLIEDGKNIIATDLSSEMLNVLKEKAKERQLDIPTFRMDMCDFDINEKMDAVLCFCDSLNYIINEDDILKVMKQSYKALNHNGYFVFDVNTLYKHNVILDDYKEEIDDDEYYFYWHVKKISDGEIKHHIIIKEKTLDEYVEEYHHQKTYDINTYKKLLNKAGFTHINIYSDFNDYNEKSEKHIFICKKG